ncbi:conjugal transfer protein TraD [Sphingomonas sp. CGMCC 1.13654]|uniref:Conjugal transfer protein TraD n=1 Tax=Sphingomonas chungangi TaxID=2683589 RepID=A0A838KZT6_9SPHN|nr:conjugal transfer protein TraD [Sphingomonas chungangi]MBA2932591.1 conjugal transfer protein TraD [Sphingomonas chungangi]MVW56214.1 conjugal transfer protein TraD [Sphingomonas chungangi]
MRKPRDFDSELKALADKAKALRERRVRQLGELVVAVGADMLDSDVLTGAMLHAIGMNDAATKDVWRAAGAAFFRGKERKPARGPRSEPGGTLPLEGGSASA